MNKAYVSVEAYKETIDHLENLNLQVSLFDHQDKPYQAVANHPDMFMFYDDSLFYEGSLRLEGKKCSLLGLAYPETVKFNIAKVGKYIICKWSAIDLTIKDHILKKAYHVIDVKQGYAKCSTAVVGSGIITSDKGIYKACLGLLDCLLIEPGHIILPGLDYGFIGGCMVTVGDYLVCNGNLSKHPDYEKMLVFIERQGLKLLDTKEPLRDIGSIIIERRQ